MLYPNPEDALRGLSGDTLERTYRAWAKRLHPDGADGNHEAFLRLQEAYKSAKSASEAAEGRQDGAAPPRARRGKKDGQDVFDPWEAVRETGRSGPLPPEECLFAALERWRQAGSPTARPVRSPYVGERNRRILRTVLHWASSVDSAFVRDFALLVRSGAGPLRTTATSRAERDARRRLEEGLDLLLRWRAEGRPATALLARERLEAAKEIVELNGLPRPEIPRLADWMLGWLGTGEKRSGNSP